MKVYELTEKDLSEFCQKIRNKVETKLTKKGEYVLASELGQSIYDSIIKNISRYEKL